MVPYNNKNSEALLKSILDNVVDVIVIIDEKGNIGSFNKAGEQLFGYSEKEVVGKNVKMLMPDPYYSHHDKYISNYVQTGVQKVIGKGRDNLEGKRKDGSRFPMYLAINEMWFDNKRMFTGIIHDITERKKYEDELKIEKEKAQRELKTNGHILSVLKNEIRTPITTIVEMAELLGKTVLSDDQKKCVTTAGKSGKNVLGVISNIQGGRKFNSYQSDTKQKETILVVDDSSDNRALISLVLKKAGYNIDEAESGEEALKKILTFMPDLILLDVEMPGMDGYDVCLTLKGNERSKGIPVIFISAKSETKDKVKGLESGAVDYITKPFHKEEILARVNNQVNIKNLTNNIVQNNRELNEKQVRLNVDLKAAAEIQQTLLPNLLPEIDCLDFAWEFKPCEQVGGDIFNVFQLDDENIALYMLDVSGHGVPSAMVTVSVAQMLQQQNGGIRKHKNESNSYKGYLSPEEVLRSLDREYPLSRFGKFFSIIYMIINIREGEVVYCNAGHPPSIILHNDGKFDMLDKGGTLIGMNEPVPFEECKHKLCDGDKIILYTDGVLEYKNDCDELFGEERFFELLNNLKNQSIGKTLDKVVKSLTSFGNGAMLEDDVSILGVEFRGEY